MLTRFLAVIEYHTFADNVPYAQHYYGRIHFQDQIIDITNVLSQTEANLWNKNDAKKRREEGIALYQDSDWVWKKGMKVDKFLSEKEMFAKAKIIFNKQLVKQGGILLAIGDYFPYPKVLIPNPMEIIESACNTSNSYDNIVTLQLQVDLNTLFNKWLKLSIKQKEDSKEALEIKRKYYNLLGSFDLEECSKDYRDKIWEEARAELKSKEVTKCLIEKIN